MAITTLDGLVAGTRPSEAFNKVQTPTMVAGRPQSLFYLGGIPGPAAAPTPGIGGAALTSYPSQIPFNNPVSGNTYLSRFMATAGTTGTLVLADRLWHNSGITITSNTEQTFTGSTTIPIRDINGASAGHGVYAAVEVSTLTGAGTPTLTFKYDNESGVEKTAVNDFPTSAASTVGSFYPIRLASGDRGVRKAKSLTLSATWTFGVIHVVLYRPIAQLDITGVSLGHAFDTLSYGLPRMYNNTVPFLYFIPSNTTASQISGSVSYAQG